MNRPLLYLTGCALASGLSVVHADDAQPVHEFSGNVAVTSDYLFRGVSQTNEGIAIQGGLDYQHVPTGLYLGTWASSIDFNVNATDRASVEWDFYGGIAGEFANGVSWDVGGIFYYYPEQNEDDGARYNCLEFYGGLEYTFAEAPLQPTVGAKFSYSGDYFGGDDEALYSEGSLDLALPQEFGLGFHVGHAAVEGNKTFANGYDYTHWSVGLSKEVAGFGLDLSYNDTGDKDGPCRGNDLCQAVVFSVSRSF
uniref:Lipoprotein n=1 Tax=Candidatus Kentrum sp. DK TaxID=2126562 RepID=A0A450SML2_9GAMM|nr:MAG: conserved hypothetical protein [Candidatus Kentron sp. DK]